MKSRDLIPDGAPAPTSPEPSGDDRSKIALLVGCNEYEPPWPPLKNATRDVEAVGRVLEDVYGFELIPLSNPTRAELLKQLALLRARTTPGAGDLLLFLFAGHGVKDEPYLAPIDAGEHGVHLVGYRELVDKIMGLGFPHNLLLLDCCYSGVLIEGLRGGPTGAGSVGPRLRQMPMDVASKSISSPVAPQIVDTITAGTAAEPVSDGEPGTHSPFARALLDACDAVSPGNAVDSLALFAYINEHIQGQDLAQTPTPCFAGDQSGFGRVVLVRPGQAPLRLLTTQVPEARVGRPYSATVRARGGAPPLQMSFVGLPSGIQGRGDGRLEGTPASAGLWTVDVRVEDSLNAAVTGRFDLRVSRVEGESPDLQVVTESLAPLFQDAVEPYEVHLRARGGELPISWKVSGLPAGLKTEHTDDGALRISGHADSAATEVGAARVTVQARDRHGVLGELPWPLPMARAQRTDYAFIEAGSFRAGYHPTPKRDRTIQRLHAEYDDFPSVATVAERYPAREPYVGAVWVKRTPVTNAEYREFVDATGHPPPKDWTGGERWFPPTQDALPVVNVTFRDAEAYCDWRGTRLPTALEWEKAARGLDGRLFPYGDEFDPALCNTREGERGETTAVQVFTDGASPHGVLDCCGNVAEWCDGGRVHADDGLLMVVRGVRGGSFVDAGRLHGMTLMESSEQYAERLISQRPGVTLREPREYWIGFRDVLDTGDAPPAQELVCLPGGRIGFGAEERAVSTREFRISRFAVSNLEYLEFVRATEHRLPRHWAESGSPFPHRERHWPVVDVSQSDAAEFCRWRQSLTRQSHTLPTASQWERAVSGLLGSEAAGCYPWGPRWQSWRCNGGQDGLGRPAAVSDYRDGATVEGVFNLAGNTYEWLAEPGVCRGGSWRSPDCESMGRSFAQARFGGRDARDSETGFRYTVY